MSKLILYVAISLDGYIADANGGVGWLDGPTETDVGYDKFISGIEAIIMGCKTYDQALTFGPWPYGEIPSYIATNREIDNPPDGVTAVKGPAESIYKEMSRKHPGKIWLMGGADLASAFRQQHLIDEYWLYLQPIWLGDGIPLFNTPLSREKVVLHSTRHFSDGMVELIYNRQ